MRLSLLAEILSFWLMMRGICLWLGLLHSFEWLLIIVSDSVTLLRINFVRSYWLLSCLFAVSSIAHDTEWKVACWDVVVYKLWWWFLFTGDFLPTSTFCFTAWWPIAWWLCTLLIIQYWLYLLAWNILLMRRRIADSVMAICSLLWHLLISR